MLILTLLENQRLINQLTQPIKEEKRYEMNKQEVIEKLKEYGAWCTECHDIHGEKDRYVKVAKVRELLEQLDEPQKVKVPAFVADWYEKHKHNLSNSLWEFTVELNEKTIANGSLSEFESWFIKHPRAYEVITSMENGYEVEKEPKWKIINDDKYCLTSIEAGYGNSLHWAFDSTKKKPILFDNEETAVYTTYITGGIVEKVEV